MIILGNYFSSCNVLIICSGLSSVTGDGDNDEVHTRYLCIGSGWLNTMYFWDRSFFLVYIPSSSYSEVWKETIFLPVSFSFWKESCLLVVDSCYCHFFYSEGFSYFQKAAIFSTSAGNYRQFPCLAPLVYIYLNKWRLLVLSFLSLSG